MEFRKFLPVILLGGLLAFGCQNELAPVQPDDPKLAVPVATGQLQLPADANLQSATFVIYLHQNNDETIYIHRVTAAWDETTVTWSSFAGAFDGTVLASFVADGIGWRSADITSLVQGWLDGTDDNFGILIDQQDRNFPRASYFSREFSSRSPYLEVCYTNGSGTVCEQIVAVADAYIWEANENNNYGSGDLLYTGWLNDSDLEKQSLLRFETEITEQACTRTIGYWKNWTGLGPQPDMVTQYLPVWLGNDGADSSIAVQNVDTAVEVLSMAWDSPKNGIIKLYAQLLAAKLNFAAGSDDSDVADVVSDADDFLAEHRWGNWYELSKDDQKMVLDWMETLDAYNNGVIGPGHCDDDDYNDDKADDL